MKFSQNSYIANTQRFLKTKIWTCFGSRVPPFRAGVYRGVERGEGDGQRVLFDFRFSMLPPKLRHILECLAFKEKNCQKRYPSPVKSHFESTMGNSFLKLDFLRIHNSLCCFNSNYIRVIKTNNNKKHKKLKNHFKPLEVPKLENLHFHFQAGYGWGTSQGRKFIPKTIFKLSVIYYQIKFFLGAFRLKLMLKKWLLQYIFKCVLTRVGSLLGFF